MSPVKSVNYVAGVYLASRQPPIANRQPPIASRQPPTAKFLTPASAQ
jgi:hypothetical protein